MFPSFVPVCALCHGETTALTRYWVLSRRTKAALPGPLSKDLLRYLMRCRLGFELHTSYPLLDSTFHSSDVHGAFSFIKQPFGSLSFSSRQGRSCCFQAKVATCSLPPSDMDSSGTSTPHHANERRLSPRSHAQLCRFGYCESWKCLEAIAPLRPYDLHPGSRIKVVD